MGVWFDDPDLEMSDIFWYNHLAKKMQASIFNFDGVLSLDVENDVMSCYVELHRIDS